MQTIVNSNYLEGVIQYGFQSATYDGAVFVSTNPPASFNRGTIQTEVVSLIASKQVPHPNTGNFFDKFYCVMMPSTTVYGPGGLNGEHSAASWIDPADGHTYRPYVAWVLNGSLNQMTVTFSHELVEAISDPDGNETQISPASSSAWNEIADICATTAFLDGVAVQSYWSQIDGACVIPFNNFNSLFQFPPAGARLQVIAIKKNYSTEAKSFWIGQIRALDTGGSGVYDLYRGQAASLIDGGTNTFFVFGTDGSTAEVITETFGNHKILSTVADDSTADNLLSLPSFK